MKNWLVPRPNAVPAKAPEKALTARTDFDRKMAAFRKATGALETFRIGFVCAKTAEPFDVLFGRASPDDKFAVTAIEKRGSGATGGAKSAAPSHRNFDIEAFSFAGWHCPYCASDTFVRCSCGQMNCRWRPLREVAGRRLYKCEPGCGQEGELVTMLDIDATPAVKAVTSPKASKAKALPAARPIGLLPRTR
ncbi:hypothetical protein RHECNPAF_178005 [Rhizobium etli CNPAF512]|nr:hypothetical protein RHECNPAF_178005 [Rhizobium etli CNPAF512]